MRAYLERRPALRPLLHRDFRLLLAGSALVSMLMPLHLMTQIFWVSAHFPGQAVIFSSVLAAARGAGMVLFSLLGGAIADRAERRKVLFACETGALAVHAMTAVLMLTEPFGSGTVAVVAVTTFFAAGVQSIDAPSRSASVPVAAGPGNLPAAIALLSICGQISMPLALPVAGFLNGVMAPGAVYAATLLAWLAILPLIAGLRFRSPGAGSGRPMLAGVRDGLRYTRAHRPIFAIVATVMVVQVLGMPVATPLGPMFEIKILGFTPAQVGLMGATWGVGSVGASMLAARARGFAMRGATLGSFATLLGVAILGFGYSRYVPLTALSDCGMGFAFTGTSLVASMLVQAIVADEVRGRVLSLFPFANGMAQVCTAIAGLAAAQVGLAFLLPALGWLVIAACGLLIFNYRQFVGSAVRPPGAPEAPAAASH